MKTHSPNLISRGVFGARVGAGRAQTTGNGSRMPMPERLVAHITHYDGVTSKTLAAVAWESRAAHPLETPGELQA